jgi:hypothetical protein
MGPVVRCQVERLAAPGVEDAVVQAGHGRTGPRRCALFLGLRAQPVLRNEVGAHGRYRAVRKIRETKQGRYGRYRRTRTKTVTLVMRPSDPPSGRSLLRCPSSAAFCRRTRADPPGWPWGSYDCANRGTRPRNSLQSCQGQPSVLRCRGRRRIAGLSEFASREDSPPPIDVEAK